MCKYKKVIIIKREFKNENMIPVRSDEATVIIMKLFDEAVAIFDKSGVNMDLNNLSKNQTRKKNFSYYENIKYIY